MHKTDIINTIVRTITNEIGSEMKQYHQSQKAEPQFLYIREWEKKTETGDQTLSKFIYNIFFLS